MSSFCVLDIQIYSTYVTVFRRLLRDDVDGVKFNKITKNVEMNLWQNN